MTIITAIATTVAPAIMPIMNLGSEAAKVVY